MVHEGKKRLANQLKRLTWSHDRYRAISVVAFNVLVAKATAFHDIAEIVKRCEREWSWEKRSTALYDIAEIVKRFERQSSEEDE